METAPIFKKTLNLDGEQILIDPANFKFNENNLSEYLQKEYSWVDYFGRKLAEFEKKQFDLEADYDLVYGQVYDNYKTNGGCTEKQAEAKTKSDATVIAAKKAINAAKCDVKMLVQHLKAWDKNHENVQSLGHFLRKSMDKLGNDIFHEKTDLDDAMDRIINESN